MSCDDKLYQMSARSKPNCLGVAPYNCRYIECKENFEIICGETVIRVQLKHHIFRRCCCFHLSGRCSFAHQSIDHIFNTFMEKRKENLNFLLREARLLVVSNLNFHIIVIYFSVNTVFDWVWCRGCLPQKTNKMRSDKLSNKLPAYLNIWCALFVQHIRRHNISRFPYNCVEQRLHLPFSCSSRIYVRQSLLYVFIFLLSPQPIVRIVF